MKKTDKARYSIVLPVVLIVILFLGVMIINRYQGKIKMESYTFTESSRELRNPNRGYYNLYRFMITDEKTDYPQQVSELYKADEHTTLSLVEINLQNYHDSEISEAGMANVENLFQELGELDKQLIVRFVYDWDGENEENEPETIDVILKHMEQLEGILQEFSNRIFILQGLFIGNWGEMNGTKYAGDKELLYLAEKLDSVTDRSIYLAVRTPSQWRTITGLQDASEESLRKNQMAGRISLYNDGMLGSESDYGTYKTGQMNGEGISEREKELKFQEELCIEVPNGGEVINDNEYNDFKNALRDLSTMHVTYLNEGHDQAVLEKWKRTKITENGCFNGMDGYTYIERHLGYRLLIKNIDFSHNAFTDVLKVSVTIKNVGFAPLYTKPEVGLVLYDKSQKTYLLYEMEGDLSKLAGGNEAGKHLTLTADIPVGKLPHTEYEVYFFITDLSTGQRILLANEQDAGEYGYCIGNIKF